MRSVISLTMGDTLRRQICRNMMRQKVVRRVIPKERAASTWPRGKSAIPARQISLLKAAAVSVSASTAAGSGSNSTRSADRPK